MRIKNEPIADDLKMDRLGARMVALAKLTNVTSKPYECPTIESQQASESWRSLLPTDGPNDPPTQKGISTPSIPTQREYDPESWRSLIAGHVETSEPQNIFLDPNDITGHSETSHIDDDEEISPVFGRRADLFVRRPSPSLSVHAPFDKLRSRQSVTDPGPFSSSPKHFDMTDYASHANDKLQRHSTDASFDGIGTLEGARADVNAELSLSTTSCDFGNDRESWPTSSRQGAHLSGSSQWPPMATPRPVSARAVSELDRSFSDPMDMLSKENVPNISTGAPTSAVQIHKPSLSQIDTTRPSSPQTKESTSHTLGKSHDDRITVSTSHDAYTVVMYMPGFSLDGITLTTKGHHRRTLHVMANKWGSDRWEHFERRIIFAADADMSQIRARFENERLIVQAPRRKLVTFQHDLHVPEAGPLSSGLMMVSAFENRRHNVRSAQF
jgi:hypothetical protein